MTELLLQFPIKGTLGAALGNDEVLLEAGPVDIAALEAMAMRTSASRPAAPLRAITVTIEAG